jgi:hypothetical protein
MKKGKSNVVRKGNGANGPCGRGGNISPPMLKPRLVPHQKRIQKWALGWKGWEHKLNVY